MKKITFLIVMLCFWMGHSQVAQRATPTLSQADSRVAAQTAPTQQTTSGNSSLSAVSRERGVASSPYTVGRAQSESTQAARVASTNAPGSISLYAAENNLEGAPFTVASRTQEIAPVSNAACAYDNPSNGWENGYNYTGAFGAVENDFIVEAGVTFDFDQITYNTFIAPGETVVSVDVEIKEDAGGVPGAVIASFAAVAPTSQTIIGGNFGFDGSEVVLSMPPVSLSEGTYWVALNNGVSSLGGPLFWEITTATMVGSPMYQNGANPDPLADGVYSFSGQCSSGSNATVINFDPTANFIGYMNVFETAANGGGYVFGSPWGVPDLKTVIDPTPVDGSATIYPNLILMTITQQIRSGLIKAQV